MHQAMDRALEKWKQLILKDKRQPLKLPRGSRQGLLLSAQVVFARADKSSYLCLLRSLLGSKAELSLTPAASEFEV